MNAMIPVKFVLKPWKVCFILRYEWTWKLNLMQFAFPQKRKRDVFFPLKLERVIFRLHGVFVVGFGRNPQKSHGSDFQGFGWDKDWNFIVFVGKTWHLRRVYGGCLPGFLPSSVKLIFEESAHMFLSGSAEIVIGYQDSNKFCASFATRRVCTRQKRIVSVTCLRRQACCTCKLFFGTTMLNQASGAESQETQNHKLTWT